MHQSAFRSMLLTLNFDYMKSVILEKITNSKQNLGVNSNDADIENCNSSSIVSVITDSASSSSLVVSVGEPDASQDNDPFMETARFIPRIRQEAGVLDPGGGTLDPSVSQWNRDLARFPARLFAKRWEEGNEASAYKYLEQSQQILACSQDITSGPAVITKGDWRCRGVPH